MKHIRSISLLLLLLTATIAAKPQTGGSTIKAASCQQADVNAVIDGPEHIAVNGAAQYQIQTAATATNGAFGITVDDRRVGCIASKP
jgi:hypothetical protein